MRAKDAPTPGNPVPCDVMTESVPGTPPPTPDVSASNDAPHADVVIEMTGTAAARRGEVPAGDRDTTEWSLTSR